MGKVNIRITRRDDTPNGRWNGGSITHAEEAFPLCHRFKGCPLGRGTTEAEALADFARRANDDDRALGLKVSDLQVTERRDITTKGPAVLPCNCENSACTDHYAPPLRPGPCQRPANPAKVAQYVGPLCDECAALMPPEYMVEVKAQCAYVGRCFAHQTTELGPCQWVKS